MKKLHTIHILILIVIFFIELYNSIFVYEHKIDGMGICFAASVIVILGWSLYKKWLKFKEENDTKDEEEESSHEG